MDSLFTFVAPPSTCGYLADETWQLEYEGVSGMTPADYQKRLERGWRRFGNVLFRPRCPQCQACRSLRVLVDRFRLDRGQRRAAAANRNTVRLRVGSPTLSAAKLHLYDRYHAYQVDNKGWPEHPARDREGYLSSFVDNPIPTQEWCYFIDDRLIGVGYVDVVPGGLSAIYFYYDPDERRRSLGTWNVLCILEQARRQHIPHLYLGYYVADCPSLAYKARFAPNQVRGPDGEWRDFRS